MGRHLCGSGPLAIAIKHAAFKLVKGGFSCLRRRTWCAPAAAAEAEHLAAACTVTDFAIDDEGFVLRAVLLEGFHLLFECVFLREFLHLGILLQLAVHFAPVAWVARLVWLLGPVGNIPLDHAEPDVACLAEYLWAVFFQLLQLCRILDVADDGLEEGEGDVANVVEHVDVFDQALPGQLVEGGYWHDGRVGSWAKGGVEAHGQRAVVCEGLETFT